MIDNVTVDVAQSALNVKFNNHVKVSTLINENFTLLLDSATPTEITDAFNEIDCEDYNSITRVLKIGIAADLEPDVEYLLRIDGVQYAGSSTEISDEYSFVMHEAVVGGPEPTPQPVQIEDFSIKTLSNADFESAIVDAPSVDEFVLVGTDPEDSDFFVEPDYNDGVVTLTFSLAADEDFLTDSYIKVQRKKSQVAPARWEKVVVTIEPGTTDESVNITFPEVAADVYFEEEYTYRIRLGRYLRANTEDETPPILGEDIVVMFSSGYVPMLIDPEAVQLFYPEAPLIEIAQWVNKFSLEVEAIFPNGDYSTIAFDYIQAATLCALSRKFEGIGTSNYSGFTLGDLQVMDTASTQGSKKDRGNATTWCELAETLRKEMKMTKGGITSSVKAGSWCTPIPSRRLRKAERGSGYRR